MYRVFQKSIPPKTFWNIFTYILCDDDDDDSASLLAIHVHVYLPIFVDLFLLFRQMTLVFPRVPIVFTLSSFE